jgi:hypothetical protein
MHKQDFFCKDAACTLVRKVHIIYTELESTCSEGQGSLLLKHNINNVAGEWAEGEGGEACIF